MSHSVIINTLAQDKEVNSFRSLFVALRPPVILARRASRSEQSISARRASRRELQVQVEVHTSPTRALAMAASSTNPYVEVAQKLAGYATYYPANASPQGYFRVYLEMAVGLCMSADAPAAITEEMFTVRGQANVSVFLRSPWWKFWRGSLPAMMRDLLPCGLDGAGDLEKLIQR